jgi:hypothetical protein
LREILKGIGHLLTGIGALVAGVTYALRFQSQNVRANSRTRALLLLLSAELDSQERVLRRLQDEPERLKNTASEALATTVWENNTERIARPLTTQDFRLLSSHYTAITQIKSLLPRTTGVAEGDELHSLVQSTVQGLGFLQYRINVRIMSLEAVQERGK